MCSFFPEDCQKGLLSRKFNNLQNPELKTDTNYGILRFLQNLKHLEKGTGKKQPPNSTWIYCSLYNKNAAIFE